MSNLFDTVEYPEVEPTRLIVGDRWLWKRTDLTDYPVASYALTYRAVRHGTLAEAIAITASESGTDYIVEVASTTTDDYKAGLYAWSAYITRSSDSERIQISQGTWELAQDLVDDHDPRTYAQIQVDSLQATLSKLNQRLHGNYSLGARQVTLVQVSETRRELNHWQHVRAAELDAERRAHGMASSSNIRVRF